MRRHLTLSEAKGALERGKQVEQFLGGFRRGDDWIIRYLVIRPEKSSFAVTQYECEDEGGLGRTDIVFFRSTSYDDDPEDFFFSSFEEAVEFAQSSFGAKVEKFVNQGLAEKDYIDYLSSRDETAAQITILVQEQIRKIENAQIKSQISSFLVEPYASEREWDYGHGEKFICWIVLEHPKSNTGIAYCSKGFGPRCPWGLLFLSGPNTSMGADYSWYSSFEGAFVESSAFDEPTGA